VVLFGTVVDMDEHDNGYGHPERPERLAAVSRGLELAGLDEAVTPLTRRPATRTELERVHTAEYLDTFEAMSAQGGGAFDVETVASAGSWRTALMAAGLGVAAIDALRDGQADAAFVAPRPPGHHALADWAMGFCLINNIAVAAAALADAGERVAIVDWDVHHGNGTQAAFWDDPRVLFASLHQFPAYPGTGRADETGGPNAEGLTVNVPLRPGTDGDDAIAAFDTIVAPAVEAFAPDWILVSAGFDAHRDDPIADLRWQASDYVRFTQRLFKPRRTIAFLEGGYDLRALAYSSAATIATLAGATPPSEK
jgi:acetoin utilization deacetylase AcuC-like enzyme